MVRADGHHAPASLRRGGAEAAAYDDYRVEVPITEWGGRQLLRVSVQGYNTHEDIMALVGALEDLLPKVS